MAELDSVLNGLSSGAPGFREFIDPVHWVDSLNGAVLREILRAGTECGYQAPPGAAGLEIPAAHGPEEDDARRLSYSVSWISAAREGFSEPALAELGFLFDKKSMLLKSALTLFPGDLAVGIGVGTGQQLIGQRRHLAHECGGFGG